MATRRKKATANININDNNINNNNSINVAANAPKTTESQSEPESSQGAAPPPPLSTPICTPFPSRDPKAFSKFTRAYVQPASTMNTLPVYVATTDTLAVDAQIITMDTSSSLLRGMSSNRGLFPSNRPNSNTSTPVSGRSRAMNASSSNVSSPATSSTSSTAKRASGGALSSGSQPKRSRK